LNWRTVPAATARQAILERNERRIPATLEECRHVAGKLGLGYSIKTFPPKCGIQPCTSLEERKILVPLYEDETITVRIALHELYEVATYEEIAAPYHYRSDRTENHYIALMAQFAY
jgi:hypothetical protein